MSTNRREVQFSLFKGEKRDVTADVQAARELRNMARVEAHVARISDQEQQAAAQYEQRVRNQTARTCDARRRQQTQQKEVNDRTMDIKVNQLLSWLMS